MQGLPHGRRQWPKNRVGPHLNDLFGRVRRRIEGFKYSNAMLAAGEAWTVWDEVTARHQFLVKPKDYIKGTKMAFAGLRKADDVANVIAYLKGFSEGRAAEAGDERDLRRRGKRRTEAEGREGHGLK